MGSHRSVSIPRSVDAWPSGPRRLGCLACGARFPSQGKAERLCPRCRDARRHYADAAGTGGAARRSRAAH